MSLGGEEVEDFIYPVHSGEAYLVAPNEWTPYYFNVSELIGTTVRFAINCISEDGFIFMLDKNISAFEGIILAVIMFLFFAYSILPPIISRIIKRYFIHQNEKPITIIGMNLIIQRLWMILII
jgi:hypothetical protein